MKKFNDEILNRSYKACSIVERIILFRKIATSTATTNKVTSKESMTGSVKLWIIIIIMSSFKLIKGFSVHLYGSVSIEFANIISADASVFF